MMPMTTATTGPCWTTYLFLCLPHHHWLCNHHRHNHHRPAHHHQLSSCLPSHLQHWRMAAGCRGHRIIVMAIIIVQRMPLIFAKRTPGCKSWASRRIVWLVLSDGTTRSVSDKIIIDYPFSYINTFSFKLTFTFKLLLYWVGTRYYTKYLPLGHSQCKWTWKQVIAIWLLLSWFRPYSVDWNIVRSESRRRETKYQLQQQTCHHCSKYQQYLGRNNVSRFWATSSWEWEVRR